MSNIKNSNTERYGNRILAKNVHVSNDTKITGLNNNDLIIASSGAGKTGSYVVPNIQNLDSSLVVVDTKGQLYRLFAEELEKKGYNVYCMNFINPKTSCVYNPLDYIGRYEDGGLIEKDVLTIATMLTEKNSPDKEPIWNHLATSFVVFLIAYCMECLPLKDRNLIKVAELSREFNQLTESDEFTTWCEKNSDSLAAKKYTEINNYMPAEKMFSSVRGFVDDALQIFNFAEAKYLFDPQKSEKAAFDIKFLGKEKTALFMNVSDTDASFDTIVNLVYAQTFHVLHRIADANPNGKLMCPVRIIMDDFAATAKIANFDRIMSVIRSRDIYVSIILQNVFQLNAMYTIGEVKSIVDNCDHWIFMGCNDYDMAEYIGKRVCKQPETILQIPNDKVYIITRGCKPALADKIEPYSTLAQDYDRAA